MLRLIKLNVLILICLLSVCVACLGLCVFTSLQDYQSNDFTFQSPSDSVGIVQDVAYVEGRLRGRPVASRIDGREFAAYCLQVLRFRRAAENPLQLIFVQRI